MGSKKSGVTDKKILLGVTGSIACYKACDLVRQLRAEGAIVQVVMTKAATQFVTPLTFQALSENKVRTDIFNLTDESEMGHIQLAAWPDLIVIAPVTADFISRVAVGLCDDLLSTLLCVTRAPVLMAPAMNVYMYENAIIQENVAKLKKHGYQFIGPASGDLACGYNGSGRLVEPAEIVSHIKKIISK